jgi:hypothetical protein
MRDDVKDSGRRGSQERLNVKTFNNFQATVIGDRVSPKIEMADGRWQMMVQAVLSAIHHPSSAIRHPSSAISDSRR